MISFSILCRICAITLVDFVFRSHCKSHAHDVYLLLIFTCQLQIAVFDADHLAYTGKITHFLGVTFILFCLDCWRWWTHRSSVWAALPLVTYPLGCFHLKRQTCFQFRAISVTDRETGRSLVGHCGFQLVCGILMKGFFICIAHGVKGHYYNLLCFVFGGLQIELKCQLHEVEPSVVDTHFSVAF